MVIDLNRDEIHVVDGPVPISVDQVDAAAADPFYGRDIQFHGPGIALYSLSTQVERSSIGPGRVLYPECDGADGRSVLVGELLGKAVRLCVDDEVDVSLRMQAHILAAVFCRCRETHLFKQAAK